MTDGPRRRGGRGTGRPSGPPRGRRPLDYRPPSKPADDASAADDVSASEHAAPPSRGPAPSDDGPWWVRPTRDDETPSAPADDDPWGKAPPRRSPPSGDVWPRRRPRSDGDAPRARRSDGHDSRGRESRRGGDRPSGDRRGGAPRRRPDARRRPESKRPRRAPDPAEIARREARARVAQRLIELDEIELTIEKLVHGGEGLGRFEGIPIFVSRSAPGDRLRVRLTERKSSFGRAEIVEILEPGAGRREPPCPAFDRCGGCDLQHLDEATQLRAKSEAVIETLRRLGNVQSLPEAFEVLPGQPWGYRTRTQLHTERTDRGVQVGYFARGSHDLVAVDHCPVLVPELDAELRSLPRRLRDRETPPQRLDLAAGDGGAWTVSPPQPTLPQGEIISTIGERSYEWDARTFFQGHRQLAETLIDRVLGEPGEVDPDAVAYDLYAGVGLFALPLAERYGQVLAIEGDRVAARFARKNARRAGASNVQIETHMLESWIEQLPRNVERVVVDPPRTGLSDRVRRTILARRPRWLTYVSCNPSTLARDLRELQARYRIDSLTLIDLFPQTGHMETVVQLIRLDDESAGAGATDREAHA